MKVAELLDQTFLERFNKLSPQEQEQLIAKLKEEQGVIPKPTRAPDLPSSKGADAWN